MIREAAEGRRHRAALAERLLADAPDEVGALDWDALARAPEWLALADAERAVFQCRVGAVLCTRSLCLWIDGPRLAAAADLLGETFLKLLLAQPDAQTIPLGLVSLPPISGAGQVRPLLRSAGAAVLLASLAHGPLRRAAEAALAPVEASMMTHELAATIVERSCALAAQAAAATETIRSAA